MIAAVLLPLAAAAVLVATKRKPCLPHRPPPIHAAAIQDAFRYFARRGAAAMVIPEFVPTPDNLAFTGAVARLDRAIYRLIGERRRRVC